MRLGRLDDGREVAKAESAVGEQFIGTLLLVLEVIVAITLKEFLLQEPKHTLSQDFFEANDFIFCKEGDLSALRRLVEAVVHHIGVKPGVLRVVRFEDLVFYLISDFTLLNQVNTIDGLVFLLKQD